MYQPTGPFYLKVDDDLELRQRLPEDACELFTLTDSNREYLMQWLPWLDHCRGQGDTLRNIEASLHDAVEGTGLGVAIFERGRLVGVTGFNSIDRNNRIGHVGYWLGKEHQGRGIMTRSVRALVAHGFGVLGLNRITIAAATTNRGSRAIAERLGFRLEGIAREAECLYGRMVDHALYAQTRADWKDLVQDGMRGPCLRALSAIDLPAVSALWHETEGVEISVEETYERLSAFLDRNPGISSVVVDATGRRIGALLGGHDGRRAYLYYLAVHPGFRRQGVGRALVQRTTEALMTAGIERAMITAYANSAEGRTYWARLGWTANDDLCPMLMQLST